MHPLSVVFLLIALVGAAAIFVVKAAMLFREAQNYLQALDIEIPGRPGAQRRETLQLYLEHGGDRALLSRMRRNEWLAAAFVLAATAAFVILVQIPRWDQAA